MSTPIGEPDEGEEPVITLSVVRGTVPAEVEVVCHDLGVGTYSQSIPSWSASLYQAYSGSTPFV